MGANQIEVIHTRVFAADSNGGNPCPVIPYGDQLSDDEMQRVAQIFGLDTVFILRSPLKDANIRLRYFVPDHEMGVSGHATIAAVTVALVDRILDSNDARIETLNGVFNVRIQGGESPLITLDQNKPVFGPADTPNLVSTALKINSCQIDLGHGPIQSVSVSRAKLLVPLQDSGVLNCLTPNFDALWQLCEELQVTGLYPFTRQTGRKYAYAEARQFPLRAGFPEDAATGVAAAALGAYLARYDLKQKTGRHRFSIAQGFAMGAPSLIEAIVDCADGGIAGTAICGVARIVAREHVTMEDQRRGTINDKHKRATRPT